MGKGEVDSNGHPERKGGRLFSFGRASLMAFVLVWGTSSCSPAPEPVVAVESLDGATVRLLTMTCDEFIVERFSVHQNGNYKGPLRKWAVSRDFTGPDLKSVQVFREPEGWRTYGSGITRFERGATYVASVRWG
ncbi:hypothetical protein GCM10020367_17480 [Streptomyces sannanensis]|uniref:Uncharacterized protein n=1 Tax=Streptomyces sannanensis TaxID=285536 RepID=A0ABP6S8F8_9ACTN